jgi:hypothetical protein
MSWVGWWRRREGEPWNRGAAGATLNECARRLAKATRGMKLRNTDEVMTAGGYPNIPPDPNRPIRKPQ